MLHIVPTFFWRYIDIFPDRTYLDTRLIDFFHSRSLVNPLGNEEVLVSIFHSVGYSSAVNDVVQAGLNSVVEIIESLALLDTSLNVVTIVLAEGVLSTIVWEVGVDWCRFSNITFR